MAPEFPEPNIMEFRPPILSVIRFIIYWPRAMMRTTGSTQLSKMLIMGEVCSMISLVNFAPESYRRCVRSGSFIRPVL